MKILVFTEGTILMHSTCGGITREQRAQQSKNRVRTYINTLLKQVSRIRSIHDYRNYIPVGNAVKKLNNWKRQEAEIYYLTSRTAPEEIADIQSVLNKYNFPDNQNLLYRKQGEQYKDVAERLLPDIIVEDDCESIGGEIEMTYPHIRADLKSKIKSIIVKEFGGIDHLPNDIKELFTIQ
ncbi:hypothetical protein A3D03_05605 [Candidatus Gottesmanbacteria bacterium RIFCSPHIGHO2_02_FULL_40_13]|uniref:Uncharacterized protein n=1 Tax=Candidatus Gottesmanbacteria bacterium RIFCSPHIGHO2_02_FULL_40_13 TaxID=1798384 RepID=A0A1F6AAM9_9BACT|nr:MAG: hypothetical protein A3D03_05605 [Candidatus Gottesmanbacteria bacterium RIFCSPHIGHO2_02_FULL_40_13]